MPLQPSPTCWSTAARWLERHADQQDQPGALTGRFSSSSVHTSSAGTNYAFSATYTSSTLALNSQGKVITGTVLLIQ